MVIVMMAIITNEVIIIISIKVSKSIILVVVYMFITAEIKTTK